MDDDHSPLIASHFKHDSRIVEGKKLMMEAVRSYQKSITAVRPPQSNLIQKYEEIVKAFNIMRGGNLYFPYLGSGWGHGPLVELLDGSIKYDMISGIGPHFWGHSYPPLIEVAIGAALNDTIMQGHLQQNYDAVVLSELLIKASGLDHCFLSSVGAMANENALKIAFQHKFPANRILAFDHCFMGRTLALSQITDKPAYREGLPPQLHVDYVPFYDPENPEESTRQALHVLHQHLARYPHQHAVMCFELIQGEGGFNTGTTDFFMTLIRLLKEHDVLIFIDEIQTFGRTPQLFAYQYFHLEESVDLVSIGKLSQVCATLFRSKLKPKAGLLSQTFTSSSIALQTSYWIVQHLLSDQFYGAQGKLVQLHAHFEEHFKCLEKQLPGRIRGPYGIGAMVIFTPFDGEAHRVARFVQDLFQAGVISFVAGNHPTRVRFLIPAGVMTLEDVDAVMHIVEKVLAQDQL
jgi:acetylornithine/N-succinyldiaminopimelate aminotransferase